jgi:hypothetical protein
MQIAREYSMDIPLIADKNFMIQRKKYSNGEKFRLISENDNIYILESLETSEQIVLTNSSYRAYIKPYFCLTIDKVQGLGFDNVAVFYDSYAMGNLATKTKYYTALSRAKKELVIYFEKVEIQEAILNSENQNKDLIRFDKYKEIEQLLITNPSQVNSPARTTDFIRATRNIYKL